jgi:Amidohydrolase
MDRLRALIRSHPVIDNHCHNLLQDLLSPQYAFEVIVSEAQGLALEQSAHSVSRLRAEKQLKSLYSFDNIEASSTWKSLLKARREHVEKDPNALVSKCLEGIHCMLIDDGFADINDLHPVQWHSQFNSAPARRVLRIESLAEELLSKLLFEDSTADLHNVWSSFVTQFTESIKDALGDPQVVGFKSIICYRTGLDVAIDFDSCSKEAEELAFPFLLECQKKENAQFQSIKPLNDFLVLQTLELIRSQESSTSSDVHRKPLQFHTGLGDSDLDLRLANPVYLQRLAEKYTNVPFVLLHSSYPYTRQAGYLAAQYANVYLDLGLVFPMISREGQISILQESLDLTPYSKLLFSTDGYFFPETFWLSLKQFREALEEVRYRLSLESFLFLQQQ